MITAIFKREFAGYFRTPLAYVILAVFLVLASACCFFIGRFFDTNTASLEPFFNFLPWLFLFLATLLTFALILAVGAARGSAVELRGFVVEEHLDILVQVPVQAESGRAGLADRAGRIGIDRERVVVQVEFADPRHQLQCAPLAIGGREPRQEE